MAQFVTHIQPTLVEASHHHPPHYYHKDHHKECHLKDCYQGTCHHHIEHHKDIHHKECSVKDCHRKECHKDGHRKDGHHKECTVKDCHHKECHGHHKEKKDKNGPHDKESTKSPPLSDESLKDHHSQSRKSSQGHFYKDSHGFKHEYDIRFVDERGICRDSEVRTHYNDNQQEEQRIKEEHDLKIHSSRSRSEHEVSKPTPPQYIDIQPVHTENKTNKFGQRRGRHVVYRIGKASSVFQSPSEQLRSSPTRSKCTCSTASSYNLTVETWKVSARITRRPIITSSSNDAYDESKIPESDHQRRHHRLTNTFPPHDVVVERHLRFTGHILQLSSSKHEKAFPDPHTT